MTSPRSPHLKRVAPYIAMRSCLSRRQAEQAILEGRVKVRGQPMTNFLLSDFTDLTLDDHPLQALPSLHMWRYYKPRGQLVTRHDPQGRPTIFQALRHFIPEGRLVSVGRLDYESEGLLLITNRPSLAHFLERSFWKRRYEVEVKGQLRPPDLDKIREGACIQGIHYRPCEIILRQATPKKARLEITLQEGKNREIRILMESIKLSVTRLVRLTFGPFALGPLSPGQIVKIPNKSLGVHIPSSILHY